MHTFLVLLCLLMSSCEYKVCMTGDVDRSQQAMKRINDPLWMYDFEVLRGDL